MKIATFLFFMSDKLKSQYLYVKKIMKNLEKFIETTIRKYLNENKYLDPTYRKIMDIYDVPVDFMWQYREFDRCGDDNIYGNEYIEKLTADIKENGIKIPIKLQIDSSDKGLIIEGNHRLCIAIKLGFKTIPVQVIYGNFGSINKHKAKPIDYSSDKWRMGIFSTEYTIEQLKGIAKNIIKNFELPYYEYKDKLNFEHFDNWLIGNKQVIDFLIGNMSIHNISPYNNNRNITNEILNLIKSRFNKEIR